MLSLPLVQVMQQANRIPAAVLKRDIAYAGFWRRLLAYLIDLLVIGAVGATLGTLVITVAPDNRLALANVLPVTSAIGWAYFVLFETSPARGTLGKIALNLFVADVHGDPISYPRAALRYLFKTFSTLLLGLGWIMAAFTPRKQALHDLMAGTLVLRRVTYLMIGQEPPTEPGDYWDGGRWVASVRPMEKS
jgi:uncharacterized RDD family membrane protein YckC